MYTVAFRYNDRVIPLLTQFLAYSDRFEFINYETAETYLAFAKAHITEFDDNTSKACRNDAIEIAESAFICLSSEVPKISIGAEVINGNFS